MKPAPLTPKETSARGKADRLIAWFDGIQKPQGPLIVAKHLTITDLDKMIGVATARLNRHRPLSLMFNTSYFDLYELKQFLLKNELNSTTNRQD